MHTLTISFLSEQRAFPENGSCRTWELWKCKIAVSVHLLHIHQSVANLLLIQRFRYALSEHPATSQGREQRVPLLDHHQGTHQRGCVCWPLTLGEEFLYGFLEDSIYNFLIFFLFLYSPMAICLNDVPSPVLTERNKNRHFPEETTRIYIHIYNVPSKKPILYRIGGSSWHCSVLYGSNIPHSC